MIGDIIKKNRTEKNLTLTKLAELAGVSKAYLFNLENNNQTNPSLDIANKIAKVLEIEPFVLLNSSEEGERAEEKTPNPIESFFEIQKRIEELHSKQLEDLQVFIDFLLWKRSQKQSG